MNWNHNELLESDRHHSVVERSVKNFVQYPTHLRTGTEPVMGCHLCQLLTEC